MTELLNKLVKILFITGVSICLAISTGVLSIFGCIGGNYILGEGGSTIILHSIPEVPQGVAILQQLGAAFITILIELSSVFLAVFTFLFWLLFIIWILRNELHHIINWILAIKINWDERTVTFPKWDDI
jgi:hypothetical protein